MKDSVWYRIKQMRDGALAGKKRIPSRAELTEMFRIAAESGMACPACKREMLITSTEEGRSQVVTLQHNRDGSILLICLGCNVKHQFFPGDSFYEAPPDHKWCNGCERLLPLSDFNLSRKATNCVTSFCKKCQYARHKAWTKANRARASEYERLRRQKKKEAINAAL